jgi:hypothetical protein
VTTRKCSNRSGASPSRRRDARGSVLPSRPLGTSLPVAATDELDRPLPVKTLALGGGQRRWDGTTTKEVAYGQR